MLPAIPHQLYAETAAVAQQLASHGFRREALFTLGESIKAARTESDLRGVKQFIVPCIRTLQGHEVASTRRGAILNMYGLPMVVQVNPYSAANFLTMPWDAADIFGSVKTSPAEMEGLFHFAGHTRLKDGKVDGVNLLVEAARISSDPQEHLRQLAKDLDDFLQPREEKPLNPELAQMLASVAQGFAQAQALPTAASIGLMALSGQSRETPWKRLVNIAPQWKAEVSAKRFVREITVKLDQFGYPAESSLTYPVAARIPDADASSWEPVWNAVSKEMEKPKHAALRSAVQKASSAPPLSIGEVVNQVKNELFAKPPRARTVSAWLEDASLPLRAGVAAKIGVDISHRVRLTIAERPLRDLDWRGRDQLSLLITMTGHGAFVEPRSHSATLSRERDMKEPVYFRVTPFAPPAATLFLTISLADTLDVLEDFTINLPVEAAAAELALAGAR